MTVSVKNNSRLAFGELLELDGYEFWNLLELPVIPSQPDDTTYQIKTGDRIDLLAFTIYGNSILWWVLAVANGMEFLPTDFNVGRVIRVPSSRFILQSFFQKADNTLR
jgi:hypothetical protein